MDIMHWLNFTCKDKADQLDKKEFNNDAVNNNLDLRNLMDQWALRTREQVKDKVPIARDPDNFNPCSYHWLMTPHVKTCMLQRYNKLGW